MGSKDRSDYFIQRREALKMVSTMVEKEALEQLDDILRAEGETRSSWLRRVVYEKAGYQKKRGITPTDGVYAVCPQCGQKAATKGELEQMFGWRVLNGTVRPQAWCRNCRSANVSKERR